MGPVIFIKQLLRDLWSQKLRSSLTIFGIVWGTAAVALLLAFGNGMQAQQMKSFAGLGEYIVITWPSQTSLPFAGLPKGRRLRLTEDDMQLLRSKVHDLGGVSGEWSDGLLLNYGDKRWRTDVSGVSPEFGGLRNIIAAAGGRFINELDELHSRRSIFLGDKLAGDVFGTDDPIGKVVLLGGSPFQVVGVMKPKSQDSSYSGRDNEKAFVPASTFRALTGYRYVGNFIFKATSNSLTEKVKRDVIGTLAQKHHFDPADTQALGMWDTTEMFTFFNNFMLGFKSFLGGIGALTLIVGGIGVSNIMHVAVEERSKEIGIKMALGAKPTSILTQFLGETMIITAIGGVLGLCLAWSICKLVGLLPITEFVGTPTLSPGLTLLAVVLLGLIGLAAGWFPAREAARLDPVVAMKL
ncbi:MAG: ABC transporter permease [Acidobacteriota bacterium]